MANAKASSVPATAEESYARIIAVSTLAGLAFMLVPFILYLRGFCGAAVPFDRLEAVWAGSSKAYLAEAGLKSGWAWLNLVHRGDVMCCLGIAVLGLCSVAALAVLLVRYLREGDLLYAILAALETAVLAAAVSGVVNLV